MRRLGRVFAESVFAASLEAIAAGGRDAFYKGEIAKKLLAGMKRHGERWSKRTGEIFQRMG